jgi:hypothetical protein
MFNSVEYWIFKSMYLFKRLQTNTLVAYSHDAMF